jgi:hypothetical protein
MAADRDSKFIVEFEDGTRDYFFIAPRHFARGTTLLGSLLAIDRPRASFPRNPSSP